MSLWVLTVGDAVAGYFELRREDDGSVEIVYFGLLPEFTGRGLGGYLLTDAVERAWASGARRVWLHTCSFDHPLCHPELSRIAASRVFKTEQYLDRGSSQWIVNAHGLTQGCVRSDHCLDSDRSPSDPGLTPTMAYGEPALDAVAGPCRRHPDDGVHAGRRVALRSRHR